MKMKLRTKKNILKNIKINIKLSKKNLLIFLISFLIISILIGIIFYIYLNDTDKLIIKDNINKYFTINENYEYFKLLKNSITNNIINNTINWLLGISIIGIVFILFVFFSSLFSIGFTSAAIIDAYGIKGVLGVVLYLFPTKLISALTIFITTFFAIIISIKLIKLCFLKEEIDFREEMKKYTKVFIIIIILSVLCSILEIFINPFMIKIFTFI